MTIVEHPQQPKAWALSDTALVILNLAAQRDSKLLLPLPDSLRAPAHQIDKTLKLLVARDFVEECPAKLEDAIL